MWNVAGELDQGPGNDLQGLCLDRRLGLGMHDVVGWCCRHRVMWGKVKVDRLQVFPVLLVPSALGLYDVAVWLGSPINDGPGNVFSICQGREQSLLVWTELWKGMSSVGLVKLDTLALLVREEVVSDSPCWLAGKAYWGAGTSYCVGFSGAKACWAWSGLILGPAEHFQGASLTKRQCSALFWWSWLAIW